MKTKTTILTDDEESPSWTGEVFIDQDDKVTRLSVEANADTILCRADDEAFKTYPWIGRHIEHNFTLAALKYWARVLGNDI